VTSRLVYDSPATGIRQLRVYDNYEYTIGMAWVYDRAIAIIGGYYYRRPFSSSYDYRLFSLSIVEDLGRLGL